MKSIFIPFGAVILCSLAAVPALAHAMELRNKMLLSRDQYLVAQKLYRGWQFVGVIVVLALVFSILLALRAQDSGSAARVASIGAAVCIGVTQLIFWLATFPVNQATRNWTMAPSNWDVLRRRWEYSHAASAVFNLGALAASVLTALWL